MNRDSFNHLNELNITLDFESFKSEILYWGLFDGTAWWRNYMHIHSFFEICYVFSGKGVFTINGVTHDVKKGDLFIARPGEKHEIIADEDEPMGIYFWAYTLVPVSGAKEDDVFRVLSAFIKSKEIICSHQSYSELVLNTLTYETKSNGLAYRYMVESLVKQLIIETARAATDLSPLPVQEPANGHKERIVRTIKRYLSDNYSQPLKLEQIAAQVHLSERHMTRIFKEVTGIRIKQYFTQVKIDIAKQLMLDTKSTVFEIAYQTGFQDARHFSTVFRKYVGMSPTAYREQGGTEFI